MLFLFVSSVLAVSVPFLNYSLVIMRDKWKAALYLTLTQTHTLIRTNLFVISNDDNKKIAIYDFPINYFQINRVMFIFHYLQIFKVFIHYYLK